MKIYNTTDWLEYLRLHGVNTPIDLMLNEKHKSIVIQINQGMARKKVAENHGVSVSTVESVLFKHEQHKRRYQRQDFHSKQKKITHAHDVIKNKELPEGVACLLILDRKHAASLVKDAGIKVVLYFYEDYDPKKLMAAGITVKKITFTDDVDAVIQQALLEERGKRKYALNAKYKDPKK